jgi:hypothetical protein
LVDEGVALPGEGVQPEADIAESVHDVMVPLYVGQEAPVVELGHSFAEDMEFGAFRSEDAADPEGERFGGCVSIVVRGSVYLGDMGVVRGAVPVRVPRHSPIIPLLYPLCRSWQPHPAGDGEAGETAVVLLKALRRLPVALLVELEASLQRFNLGGGLVLHQLVFVLPLLDGGEEPIHDGSQGLGVGVLCWPQDVGNGLWGDGSSRWGVLLHLVEVVDTDGGVLFWHESEVEVIGVMGWEMRTRMSFNHLFMLSRGWVRW